MIFFYLSGALLAIGLVSFITLTYSKQYLQNATYRQLSSLKEIKKMQIVGYMQARVSDLRILAEAADTQIAFDMLREYHQDDGTIEADGRYKTDTEEYNSIYSYIDMFYRKYLDEYGYQDVFFMCSYHGHVMYTASQGTDLGANLKTGEYKDSSLAKLWSKVIKEKKTIIMDFAEYAPSKDNATLFIGTPVTNKKGDVLAVIALQISKKEINDILHNVTKMGDTGEMYLVGKDNFMRSDSRLSSKSTILRQKVVSPAVDRGFDGKTEELQLRGYRGKKVLSSFAKINLNTTLGTDFDWVLIAEITTKEAFSQISSLTKKILWAVIGLSALSVLVAYLLARSISKPLANLSELFWRMAEGDLTVTGLKSERTDEVGQLITSSSHMLEKMRGQVIEIKEGASRLASSISEITATATQLATSSTETSTTIAEVGTTVEEVRHTVHLSNEKAEQVAIESSKASEISITGKHDSEEAVSGMKKITDEMDYIAESIVRLSEQTVNIGEIIGVVNDLTDQSNLLSVNAAIEAAKAGEYGKGFSVVAQEVKSLAEQSKEATGQVKTILNDIQKATSAAVMATERGGKVVHSGMELSAEAGKTISTLAMTVSVSSQAAGQISASSQQQLRGMDQLVLAMESIKDATTQNVDGARQLENASRDLEEIGNSLKLLSEQFKV